MITKPSDIPYCAVRQDIIRKADVLIEALPYIKKYNHMILNKIVSGRDTINIRSSLDKILFLFYC